MYPEILTLIITISSKSVQYIEKMDSGADEIATSAGPTVIESVLMAKLLLLIRLIILTVTFLYIEC
jgi:hypothetical protein